MRILLLHQYYLEKDDDGGSRFNEMTKHWTSREHDVVVLAGMVHYGTGKKADRYKGKYVYKDIISDDLTVWRSHVSEAYNVNFIGRLWAYFSFVFSSMFTGLFKAKGEFDVMVVTSPPLFVGISAYIISRMRRIPLLFEVRDLWPESAIDTGVLTNKFIIKLAYKFERYIYDKADKINVLTPAFRISLIENKNVPDEKISFIPNAADFSLSESLLQSFDALQWRKELKWEDKFIIVYVGAHGKANHLVQLIDAAEKLQDTKVHFVLIGSGMEKPQLIEDAKKRNLDNIQFIDPVPKPEVFKYILASDMGTSVLKNVDTFKTIYSNKTFDYMSCKKPILMAIDGVSRILIENAKCGMYVEPENSEDYNKKIRQCMANPDVLKRQGESGYIYARENFDREMLADKYLTVLENLRKKS